MTGHLVAAAILALEAASCASQPASSPPTLECCVSQTVRIDPSFTDEEREDVREAMRVWARGTNGAACFTETGGDYYALAIVRIVQPAELKPYDSKWSLHVGLHRPGIIWMLVGFDHASETAIAAHEIGHSLFLLHDDDPSHLSVMRSIDGALDGGVLPLADRKAFFASHGECR